MYSDEGLLRTIQDGARIAIDPTEVPGLDLILGGGLARGALVMVMGSPGSGKTVLANQIAFNAAHAGRRALVLTALSESTNKLIAHLRAFTFFNENMIGDAIQFLSVQQFLERGLAATREEIVALARASRADLVVIDGFRGIYGTAFERQVPREFLYDLGTALAVMGATTLVTGEIDPYDTSAYTDVATADTIIGMHYDLSGVRARRGVDIIKSRGQESLSGLHELLISDEGVEVYPRLEARVAMTRQHAMRDLLRGGVSSPVPTPATTAPPWLEAPARFDLPELDKLLGGGFMRNTSTVIVGESGTGKTTFALQFALAGTHVGEPVLYLGFYETVDQLLIKADHLGFGAEMRAVLAPSGPLTLVRMEPVELHPDVIANQLLQLLDVTSATRLVIDGASELEEAARSSGDTSRVAQYIAALLELQRMRGITVLLTRNIMRSVGPLFDLTQQPLALAADNVIVLQHVIHQRRLHNMLAVLKTRFSAHDPGMREFTITERHRLRVLAPLESRKSLLADTSEAYGLPAEGTPDSATPSSPRKESASRARPSLGRVSHRPRFSRTETGEES